MRFRFSQVIVVAAITFHSTFCSTQCCAYQSGSRGSAPSTAAPSTPSFAAPQSFSAPSISSQPFSAPQNFSSPVMSQPFVEGAQGLPSSQPVVIMNSPQSVPFGDPMSNTMSNPLGDQFISPQAIPPSNMPMPQSGSTAGGGSSSPGVPNSSLVDPIFQISDANSPYTVDNSTWNCFLSKYLVTDVQGINRVRYGAVTGQDRRALKNYLQQLQAVDTRTLNSSEQLAFWFNLYNARTVDIVLDNYPIRSIRQVKQKFTDFVGPFDDEGAVNVLGKSLSLNDIESGIVRPVWNDPRIHYALNCASFGCPNLSSTAWTARTLDGDLNSAAYRYINSGRAVKRGLRGVQVAKIYKWYKDDFGGTDQAVLNHMRQFASPATQNLLSGQQKIAGYFYDWSLNDGRILRRRLFEPLIR